MSDQCRRTTRKEGVNIGKTFEERWRIAKSMEEKGDGVRLGVCGIVLESLPGDYAHIKADRTLGAHDRFIMTHHGAGQGPVALAAEEALEGLVAFSFPG